MRKKCNAGTAKFEFVESFPKNSAIQTGPKVLVQATTWCLLAPKLLSKIGPLSFEKSFLQIWRHRCTFPFYFIDFPVTEFAKRWTPHTPDQTQVQFWGLHLGTWRWPTFWRRNRKLCIPNIDKYHINFLFRRNPLNSIIDPDYAWLKNRCISPFVMPKAITL